MRNLIGLFILSLVTSAASAGQDYWVWVDKNGITNYAEHEPDGIANARHITTAVPFGERIPGVDSSSGTDQAAGRPGSSAKDDASGKGGVNPDAAVAGQKAAIKSEIAEIKRKNCEIGKNNLAKLESYSNIRVKDANGKVRVLSEQEHQARIKQARQVITQNCSG